MGFQAQMDAFREERGWGFTYLVALFEGAQRGPPTTADARAWAEATAIDTPVLADVAQALPRITPFESSIPYRCALSPELEMLHCYAGEPQAGDPAIMALVEHRQGEGG